MNHDLRVQVTKQMLKEGLLRCIVSTPISGITVTDLCREAGVNRATFYNHYGAPTMVLREIAEDYARHLREIYYACREQQGGNREQAILSCLRYLYDKKEEIKILLSPNAENYISGFGLEIIKKRLSERADQIKKEFPGSSGDYYLASVLTASAAYGLFQIWLVQDIDKTPEEIVELLKSTFVEKYFL